jgi:hypothetical protein
MLNICAALAEITGYLFIRPVQLVGAAHTKDSNICGGQFPLRPDGGADDAEKLDQEILESLHPVNRAQRQSGTITQSQQDDRELFRIDVSKGFLEVLVSAENRDRIHDVAELDRCRGLPAQGQVPGGQREMAVFPHPREDSMNENGCYDCAQRPRQEIGGVTRRRADRHDQDDWHEAEEECAEKIDANPIDQRWVGPGGGQLRVSLHGG